MEEAKCLVSRNGWRKELAFEIQVGWRRSTLAVEGRDKASSCAELEGPMGQSSGMPGRKSRA